MSALFQMPDNEESRLVTVVATNSMSLPSQSLTVFSGYCVADNKPGMVTPSPQDTLPEAHCAYKVIRSVPQRSKYQGRMNLVGTTI